MMKYTDLATRQPQHLLVLGEPKTGKSTLVSKLAEAGFDLIWFSMDGGHSVLSKLTPAAQARVNIIVLPDTPDYPIAQETFRKVMDLKSVKICDKHGKVGCTVCSSSAGSFTELDLGKLTGNDIVVFDNGSQLTDSFLNNICRGAQIAAEKKEEVYKPKLDDYGALSFNMKSIMTKQQTAPFNLVMICHAIEAEMEDGSKKMLPMMGSSEFSRKVGGYYDHIVYLNVTNGSHRAISSTTANHRLLAGSRSDIAIEKMPAPDLVTFFSKPVAEPIPVPQQQTQDEKAIESRELDILQLSGEIETIKDAAEIKEVLKTEQALEVKSEMPAQASSSSSPEPAKVVNLPVKSQAEIVKEKLLRLRNGK